MGIGFMKKSKKKDKESSKEKNLKEKQNESNSSYEKEPEVDQANTKKIKSKNKKTVKEKFKEFRKNAKGVIKDSAQKNKKIARFEVECENLKQDPVYLEMYPDGFDPHKKILATPDRVELIYKFVNQLVNLHYGKASEIALPLCESYTNLKLRNTFAGLQKVAEEKSIDVLELLNDVGQIFEDLDPAIQKELASESSDFFSKMAILGAGGLAAAGTAVGATGIGFCTAAQIDLAAGWTGWIWTATGAEWALSSVVSAGTIAGIVGLVVAAASALTVAIIQFCKNCEKYGKYMEHLKNLRKAEKMLSEVKSKAQNLGAVCDQFGTLNGELEQQIQLGDKAAKAFWAYKHYKNTPDAIKDEENMDALKRQTFIMLEQLTLADPEKFTKEALNRAEKTLAEMNAKNLDLMSNA